MRLGAYILRPYRNAEEYIALLREKGYRAAYCPEYIQSVHQQAEIDELKSGLHANDITLAEVGTWVNPLSPDRKEREAAEALLIERLALADALEARCCVNVIGSMSKEYWYAPCAQNYTDAFLEAAVSVYQKIIDAVDVKNTRMTFEVMPYCLLDDTQGYLRFLKALDRPQQTGVHLDFANMLHDPRTYYGHRAIFRDAVERLGPQLASVHVKDLRLDPQALNTQIHEVELGCGGLDLGCVLDALAALPDEIPVMLEHLPDERAYDRSAAHLRALADERGYRL